MSCTVCGSNIPCNTAGTCERCCNSCQPGVPAPFYNCAPACAEDHTKKVIIQQFYADIKVGNSWNVPACGETAYLTVISLQAIVVGSYIWNPGFGYFEVISFDPSNGQVVVQNNCTSGNAAVGTAVPGCTEFVITDPPVDTGDDGNNCVAIDFTAPDVGDCIDITVTGTVGLTSSDTIEIGSGFYFLNEIKPNNIINICNQGSGIAAGTPVIAKNADNQYQYCISIISTNACDREAIQKGNLLACSPEDVTSPLGTPCEAGYIPVSVDSDCRVEMRPGIVAPTCTHISVETDISSGDATYDLPVDSSSGFSAGQILLISGRTDRMVVTAIPDAETISVTFLPTPGANSVIPVGALVCTISCCEALECASQGTRLSIPAQLNSQAITMVLQAPDPSGSYEVTLDSNVIEYTAPDDCPEATYHVRAEVNLAALIDSAPFAAGGEAAVLSNELQLDWSNNVGVGGRLNWTQTSNDGVDVHGTYPATTLNALWGVLQILVNTYPIMYHSGYVIADTLVAGGDTVTLRLNYKALQGDNIPPDDVFSVATYLIGNLVITRVL